MSKKKLPKRIKKKILLVIVLAIVGAVMAISEREDGPLPTWSQLNDEVGIATETSTTKPEKVMRVSFIDVGQGDSILVQTPDSTMLIDAGERDKGDEVVSYLQAQGVTHLDYVVATHPHTDHIGGMPKVLEAFLPDEILMPKIAQENTPTNSGYQAFLKAVQKCKKSGTKITAPKPGMTFSPGEAFCTVLAPFEQSEDMNNMSIVIRLEWGETSFLLTGDAEKKVESEMLSSEYADLLNADVLKVGHHGSRSSTSASFFKKVSPKYCVISCGVDNDYGHPHSETTERLKKSTATTLRTDESGTVCIISDGKNLRVE